eukprot:GHVU01039054.1.p1 GENE.GHVU01039054.1~~GHVU01039054.1.p1  ORF type:complete len:605 (-),score=136.67 GHVU01039054.1:393-2207(-)
MSSHEPLREKLKEKNFSDELKAEILRYAELDFSKNGAAELLQLVQKEDGDQLSRKFMTPLKFGTGGVRGQMGPGFGGLNELVVTQTAQGIAKWVRSLNVKTDATDVVVGFDGRHNSRRFAHRMAAVFLAEGMRCHLFSEPVATPHLAFSVTELKCVCGAMVTASHNPPRDNGVKLYEASGCQIVYPTDRAVAKHIAESQTPDPGALALFDDASGQLRTQPTSDPFESLTSLYQERIVADLVGAPPPKQQRVAPLPLVVYTPVHGVGTRFVTKLVKDTQLAKLHVVAEQGDIDPNFTTVAFPNPEEPATTKLALETATREGSEWVVWNDPDADRMRTAEFKDGKWICFTGDEIGALLADYQYRSLTAKGIPPSRIAFLNTAVSSRWLSRFCKARGCRYEETLTGFKWLGRRAIALRAEGYSVGLAYEEAIGFALCAAVADKDGISATLCWLLLLRDLLLQGGKRPSNRLEELNNEIGQHRTGNGYLKMEDPARLPRLFESLRNGGSYLSNIGGMKVESVRDLGRGVDTGIVGGKSPLPQEPGGEMFTFRLASGPVECVATIRCSGTEPKVKYYVEAAGPDDAAAAAAVEKVRKEVIEIMKAALSD